MQRIQELHERISMLYQQLTLSGENILHIERPQPLEMLDIDCLLVKGENLHSLARLLSSRDSVFDFCYIDPPYNTGNAFIYEDRRFGNFTSVWGKHSKWMSFMLPRLTLAHELLNEQGVIAISIDDYEYAYLKILMDAIFGPDHYIATLIVNRSKNGKGSKPHVAVNHEYVVLYGRSPSSILHGLPEADSSSYGKSDEHGIFKIDGLFRKKGEGSLREDRPSMFYPLYFDEGGVVYTERVHERLKETYPIDSKGIERRWLWGKEKATQESWKLYASPKGVVYVKNYLTDGKRIKIRSIWDDARYLTERATNEVKHIFGDKVFETPKPLGLLEDLLSCAAGPNSLILDFFAGTGTTAHAAFSLNQKDGGHRKVVLMEQKAKIPMDHIARSHGFSEISDLTEFRLANIKQNASSYKYATVDII
ncbi:site-specific DNA-methyltransferase [Paraburkholderia sp. RL17-380-BIE-A]|uniref:site-specific DNA-methyltransferase n=1 Tax=Paraburkholderia sp. RL17-380-BIE-A TaxID=3031630 RepID=UPI0038BC5B01